LVGSLFGASVASIAAPICALVGALAVGMIVKKTTSLSRGDWLRIAAIFVFFLFSIIFWGVYEQAGSTLSLFADKFTRNELFGKGFPPSYYQTLQALFVILLSPVFAWVWIRLGRREPSSPAKFAYGLFFVGLSILLMVPASMLAGSGPVSPLWLVGVYFISVIGELCLSPVGLSTVTKLAPAKFVGIMMGVWFVSIALGDFVAGFISRFFSGTDTSILVRLFGLTGAAVMIATAILAVMTPWVRRLMGRVH
jgi:POT family proton-dependent oligopeptide transporter